MKKLITRTMVLLTAIIVLVAPLSSCRVEEPTEES